MIAPTTSLKVIGRCPECGHESLFLGGGGHVTCSNAGCGKPDAASLMLQSRTVTEMLSATTSGDSEKIDHPAHYGGADDPYEAIKVIEAWGLGFALGNVLKYICRAGVKPEAVTVDDLRKAAWYLNHEIESYE